MRAVLAMIERPAMILCLLAFVGGCASAKFISTGPSYPPKPDDCELEIFTSKLPDREYEELGILEGSGSLGADTLEKVLPKMKQEACRAGGDAIILTSSQKSVSVSGTNDNVTSDEKLNVTATVVRWLD